MAPVFWLQIQMLWALIRTFSAREIWKIIPNLSLLPLLIWSTKINFDHCQVGLCNNVYRYESHTFPIKITADILTILHSEGPKLQRVLAILSAIGLKDAKLANDGMFFLLFR